MRETDVLRMLCGFKLEDGRDWVCDQDGFWMIACCQPEKKVKRAWYKGYNSAVYPADVYGGRQSIQVHCFNVCKVRAWQMCETTAISDCQWCFLVSGEA